MEMDPTTQQIAALKQQIPEAVYAQFDTYYQGKLRDAIAAAQRADTTGLGIDDDQIERQLIADLIREAEGRDNADGLGRVPTPTRHYDVKVPDHDPRAAAAPGRSTRRSSTPQGEMTRERWAAAAVLVVLVVGVFLWSLLSGTPTDASADAPTPSPTSIPMSSTPPILPTTLGDMGEAGRVTLADPASLEIRRADGSTVVLRVVPSPGILGGSWTPAIGNDQAAWLEGTVVNSVFCLPPSADTWIGSLKRGSPILLRPASGAVRPYEVLRVRTVGRQQVEVLDQRRAGMTLLRCGADGSTRTVVEAVYRPQTVQRPTHAVGTNAALADLARVQVQGVTVITPTADLPPGLSVAELEVEVTNLTTAELPWTDLADQLEIGGSVAETEPSVPEAPLEPKETRRVRFRYRVPSAGGAALWRVTAATGDSVTVRVSLPPAPRVTRLEARLTPEDVRQIGSGDTARLAITVTVTNTGTEPLTLDSAAAGVWQGATALPLHDESTPLPLIIPGGEARSLSLLIDRPDDPAALTVQIGPQRWRVQIP